MTDQLQPDLLKRVRNLPPLPESVLELQALCCKPDVAPEEVATVLKTDPMLTTNVLKATNSPFYGLSGRVTSIQHAVTLLGPSLVRGFAIAATLKVALPMDMSPYGLTNRTFMTMCTRQRALVYHWLSRVSPADLTVLGPASFIMNMGMVVIAAEIDACGQRESFLGAVRSGQPISAVETSHVGANNRTVCAHLFEHWRFESTLIDVIGSMTSLESTTGETRRLASALAAVNSLIGVTESHTEQRASDLATQGGWDVAGLIAANESLQALQQGAVS